MAKTKLILGNDVSLTPPKIDTRGTRGGYNYIQFGERNTFTQDCAELVKNSPTQQSIIDSLYKRMKGASVNIPENTKSPNLLYTWQDLIDRCLKDYAIYESFSVQVILNEDNKTYSIYHQPVADVRLGKSEYGTNDIIKAYLNTNWADSKLDRIREIKMFGFEAPKKGERYLFYFKEYEPTELYYHIPSWYSAANWIATDARLSKYYNNFVANNFNGQKHIDFPFVPDEKEQHELEKMIKSKFCGENNGGEVLITYSEGDQRVNVNNLPSVDADLYNNVTRLVTEKIVTANELPSPVIAGIATSSGFSSKAEEILSAETAYRLNVVQPKRQFVLRNINKLFHINGNGDKIITIEDYNIIEEYKGLTTRNDIVEDNGVKNNVTKETEVDNGNN